MANSELKVGDKVEWKALINNELYDESGEIVDIDDAREVASVKVDDAKYVYVRPIPLKLLSLKGTDDSTELLRRIGETFGVSTLAAVERSLNKDYITLSTVLNEAFDQAAVGKGRERHANDLPFDEQPMQTISDLLRSNAGMAFQACKKITEGLQMTDRGARERELLGAINYIAGIIIHGRRHGG